MPKVIDTELHSAMVGVRVLATLLLSATVYSHLLTKSVWGFLSFSSVQSLSRVRLFATP